MSEFFLFVCFRFLSPSLSLLLPPLSPPLSFSYKKVVAAGRGPGGPNRRVRVPALGVRRRLFSLPRAIVPVVGEHGEQPEPAAARRGDDVVESVEEFLVVFPRESLQPRRVQDGKGEEAHVGQPGGGESTEYLGAI